MKRYIITDYHAPEMSEDEEGEWVKYKDHNKEIESIKEACKRVVKLKHKEIEGIDKAGCNMSAELTYLRGVISCALGNHYPSDIGCELHELNKGVNE